jgi:MFS family permease
MNVHYDPALIYQFAERLYGRAAWVAVWYSIAGLTVGMLGGLVIGGAVVALLADPSAVHGPNNETWTLVFTSVLLFGVVGGCGGLALGFARGFMLRLQAQQALCQAKIEENTRALATQSARPT